MLYSLSEVLSPPEPSTFRSSGRPVTGQRRSASVPKRAVSALSSGSSRSPRHPGTTGSRPHGPDDLQIASTTNSGWSVRHGACIGFDHQLAAEHDLGNSCCGAGGVAVAVDALALAT